MLVFIRVVEYFKNNLKNILFLSILNLSLYQQLRKKYYDNQNSLNSKIRNHFNLWTK
jgi:hypothetical protein